MGAGAGGRLTLWLVALAVLVAAGASRIIVSGSGPAPPADGGSQDTTHLVGSSDQRPDGGQQATAQAHPVPATSSASARAAGVSATGRVGRYNVGAAHSPELLRELASPLAGTGEPSGTVTRGVDVAAAQHPGGAGIDWPQVAAAGYSFAAVKATEGTYYANPWYGADATGAAAAGLRVTGYHVAIPNVSGGAATDVSYADPSRTAVATPAEAGGAAGASGVTGVTGGAVAGSGGPGGSGGSGGLGGSGVPGSARGSGASGVRTAAPGPAASPVASAPESLVVPAATPPAAGSPSPVSPSGP